MYLQKKYGFEISITLKKFELKISLPSSNYIYIILKVGHQKIQSSRVKFISQEAVFNNETLKMNSVIYEDKIKRLFLEKYLDLLIIINSKQTGFIRLDCADYLNEKIYEKSEILSLHKCSEHKGKLFFNTKLDIVDDFDEETSYGKTKTNNSSVIHSPHSELSDNKGIFLLKNSQKLPLEFI